jgi:hypothetical protein
MRWCRVTVHAVVAEFLRSERRTVIALLPAALQPHVLPCIDQPNIVDPSENHTRLRCLALIRRQLLGEIPPDTQWYKVCTLTDAELTELYVIGRCRFEGSSENDDHQLQSFALSRPQTMTSLPSSWGIPILWGHEKKGPFTIIEGNHRLVAYASQPHKSGLSVPVFVGLSNTPCFWHIFDSPHVLVNDLWK